MNDSETPPLLNDLSEIEQAVVNAARRGVWVEPHIVVEVEELAVTEDPRLRVRAELIRELLMGRRGELDPRGLNVRGVRVIGRLDLDHVAAVSRLALINCALPDGLTCESARLRETILKGSSVPHLAADSVQVNGDLSLQDVVVHGSGERGAVRLLSAHVRGQLTLNGSVITNASGPALHADGLRTDDSLFMRNATIRGAGYLGAVRLPRAYIDGQLIVQGSELTNDTGPVLFADGLRTNENLYLWTVAIRGTGEDGAVRLLGAHIGGQLSLDGSVITNVSGPALHAEGLHTDDSLFIRDATIRGAGDHGAVRLQAAQIGSQTELRRTRLSNDSGPLLVLNGASVKETLLLATTVCSTDSSDVKRQGCVDKSRQIAVQGLVFSSLGNMSWRQWLHLLVHHTSKYSPQPYQQLATVERTAGHDNNARHVLVTQQEDLRNRDPEALGGRIGQLRHRLWGLLGRYGYRAHRLVIALALTVAVAGGLGYLAGQVSTRPDHHAAERVPPPTATTTTPGTPCSTAELIGLGIDRGLPLGATGLRARCDLDTATRWGQAFTYAIWALQGIIWALATLAIAAYTGLVRKPT